MKKIATILILLIQLNTGKVIAQNNPIVNSVRISKTELVGIWQFNSPTIGSAIGECFQFFSNGTFAYHYDPDDDTRTIIGLTGRYLLNGNELIFTITSRTEKVSNKIVTGAIGSDGHIFVFDSDSTKEVKERFPKKLDPVNIWDVKKSTKLFSIKINSRKYYKLNSDPDKYDQEL